MGSEQCPHGRVYAREDLDRVTHGGCGTPGCGCCSGPMYLHSTCCDAHVRGQVAQGGLVVQFRCGTCDKPMLGVLLEMPLPPQGVDYGTSPCCDTLFEMGYVPSSGQVTLECEKCQTQVAVLHIAPKARLLVQPRVWFGRS